MKQKTTIKAITLKGVYTGSNSGYLACKKIIKNIKNMYFIYAFEYQSMKKIYVFF